MSEIVVAGHICVDLTPSLGPSARIAPGALIGVGPIGIGLGGCVANTGIALAELGATVRLHATIGDDELGHIVEQRIAGHPNLSADLSVSATLATSYSLVIEPPNTDRTFWHHTGANAEFTGAELQLDSTDLLHVGYPPLLPGLLTGDGQPLVTLFERARRNGTTTSLDLAVVDPSSDAGGHDWELILSRVLPHTDIISPSVDDLTSALGTIPSGDAAAVMAEKLLDWGAAVVAISAGADGVLLRTAGAQRLRAGGRMLAPLAERWADVTLRTPPHHVDRVVTTNGAGDASTAGLLFAMVHGADPQTALEWAVASAAAIVTGGLPNPQTLRELAPHLAPLN